MIYLIDIDGVICNNTHGNYKKAVPFQRRINKINDLHRQGHKIILFTSRGSQTRLNWEEFTKRQLKRWNVKYDVIKFDKIEYDILIDDKSKDIKDFFNE